MHRLLCVSNKQQCDESRLAVMQEVHRCITDEAQPSPYPTNGRNGYCETQKKEAFVKAGS